MEYISAFERSFGVNHEPRAPGAGVIDPIRVRTFAERCMSSAFWMEIAPAVFDENVAGWVRPQRQTPDPDDVAAIRTATSACPTGSIDIEDADEPPLQK